MLLSRIDAILQAMQSGIRTAAAAAGHAQRAEGACAASLMVPLVSAARLRVTHFLSQLVVRPLASLASCTASLSTSRFTSSMWKSW